jgi:hypothetical protein
MNWKLLLLPLALPVELGSVVLTGFECGFGNWVLDRKIGDRLGKPWQTREELYKNDEEKRHHD